jgi:hypothetical protein
MKESGTIFLKLRSHFAWNDNPLARNLNFAHRLGSVIMAWMLHPIFAAISNER